MTGAVQEVLSDVVVVSRKKEDPTYHKESGL